jgi:hypothetical protein
MNNQGKTNKQYEDSTRFAWYGVVGMIVLLILFSLLSSCSTTKKCCDKEHVITERDGDRQINWYSSTEEK